MCDMVTLGWKSNILEPRNLISTLMTSVLDLWTPKSIENIFLPWAVHMYGTMTQGGKDRILDPESFSTPMSGALDLWTPISIGNIFLPWVVYMCGTGIVTLCEKGNILEPGNRVSTSMSSALDF
jgi:hypothetical protein